MPEIKKKSLDLENVKLEFKRVAFDNYRKYRFQCVELGDDEYTIDPEKVEEKLPIELLEGLPIELLAGLLEGLPKSLLEELKVEEVEEVESLPYESAKKLLQELKIERKGLVTSEIEKAVERIKEQVSQEVTIHLEQKLITHLRKQLEEKFPPPYDATEKLPTLDWREVNQIDVVKTNLNTLLESAIINEDKELKLGIDTLIKNIKEYCLSPEQAVEFQETIDSYTKTIDSYTNCMKAHKHVFDPTKSIKENYEDTVALQQAVLDKQLKRLIDEQSKPKSQREEPSTWLSRIFSYSCCQATHSQDEDITVPSGVR